MARILVDICGISTACISDCGLLLRFSLNGGTPYEASLATLESQGREHIFDLELPNPPVVTMEISRLAPTASVQVCGMVIQSTSGTWVWGHGAGLVFNRNCTPITTEECCRDEPEVRACDDSCDDACEGEGFCTEGCDESCDQCSGAFRCSCDDSCDDGCFTGWLPWEVCGEGCDQSCDVCSGQGCTDACQCAGEVQYRYTLHFEQGAREVTSITPDPPAGCPREPFAWPGAACYELDRAFVGHKMGVHSDVFNVKDCVQLCREDPTCSKWSVEGKNCTLHGSGAASAPISLSVAGSPYCFSSASAVDLVGSNSDCEVIDFDPWTEDLLDHVCFETKIGLDSGRRARAAGLVPFYGSNAQCVFSINWPAVLVVERFATEASKDILYVDGVPYSGEVSPNGVIVARSLNWSTDSKVEHVGWRICPKPVTSGPSSAPSRAPTAPPTDGPTPGPALAPTLAPVSSAPSESPSLFPSRPPSLPPSRPPTPHPCADGSHGCHNLSAGGICVQVGIGWRCDCARHYYCSANCGFSSNSTEGPLIQGIQGGVNAVSSQDTDDGADVPHVQVVAAHECTLITPSPTAQPSPAPPTAAPSAVPTATAVAATTTTVTITTTTTTTTTISVAPSANPTKTPTGQPTMSPTGQPTMSPTRQPTMSPTAVHPSTGPSAAPTFGAPTVAPSASAPSAAPTRSPSTAAPTAAPSTSAPSAAPTAAPSSNSPTGSPTTAAEFPAHVAGALAVPAAAARWDDPAWAEALRCNLARVAAVACSQVWLSPPQPADSATAHTVADFRIYEQHQVNSVQQIRAELTAARAGGEQWFWTTYSGAFFVSAATTGVAFQASGEGGLSPELIRDCTADLVGIPTRAVDSVTVEAGTGSEHGLYFIHAKGKGRRALDPLFDIPISWRSPECAGRLGPSFRAAAAFPVVGDGLSAEAAAALRAGSAQELQARDALAATFAEGAPLSVGLSFAQLRCSGLRVVPGPTGGVAFELRALLPRGAEAAAVGQALLHGAHGGAQALQESGVLRDVMEPFRIRRDSVGLRLRGLPSQYTHPATREAVRRALSADIDGEIYSSGGHCSWSRPCGWSVAAELLHGSERAGRGAASAPPDCELHFAAVTPPDFDYQRLDDLERIEFSGAKAALAAGGQPAGELTMVRGSLFSPAVVELGAARMCAGDAAPVLARRPITGQGRWELVSQDPDLVIQFSPSPSATFARVHGLPSGTHVLRWTVEQTSATAVVTVTPRPTPVISVPDGNTEVDSPNGLRLRAVPVRGSQTGRWRTDRGAVFSDPFAPDTVASGLAPGANQIYWEVSAPVCLTAVAVRTVRFQQRCTAGLCRGHATCEADAAMGFRCLCHSAPLTGFWAPVDPADPRSPCTVCQRGYASPETGCKRPLCHPGSCPRHRGRCGAGPDGPCTCLSERFSGADCSECAPQFAGPNCSSCAPGLYTAPGSAPCTVLCSPEADCGAAPGNGVVGCTPTGECDCGPRRRGPRCGECRPPFVGFPSCATTCSPADCGGHGCCAGAPGCGPLQGDRCICADSDELGHWAPDRYGRCDACSPGWGPPGDCRRLPTGELRCGEQSCGVHGRCDPGSGMCECAERWAGAACTHCADSAAGHWTGANCSQCQRGWWGAHCNQSCRCNEMHSSACDPLTGKCLCHRGYATGFWGGPTCSSCCTEADGCSLNWSGPDCRVSCDNATCGHGRCDPSGCTCWRDVENGFWGGERCSHCLTSPTLGNWAGAECRQCTDDWYPPGLCNVECNERTCSGHGRCGRDGRCRCSHGGRAGHWDGPRCSYCRSGFAPPDCVHQQTIDERCRVNASAAFSAARAAVFVDFSVDMTGTVSPCAAVLDATTLEAVGDSARCFLPHPRRMVVMLDATGDAPLRPGDWCVLRPTLRPVVEGVECPAFAGVIDVGAPLVPQAPRVSLRGPAEMSPCRPAAWAAFIEASTAGYSITWQVTGLGPAAEAAAAGAAGGGELFLPSESTRPGVNGTVMVTVTDQLGATASAVMRVGVAPAQALELLPGTTSAPVFDFSRPNELHVRAAPASDCSSDNHDRDISDLLWDLRWDSPSHPGLVGGAVPHSNATVLSIPPMALRTLWTDDGAADGEYVFRCRARSSSGGVASQFLFSVTSSLEPPRCGIARGSRDGLDPAQPLALLAWVEDPANAVPGPEVVWRCEGRSGARGASPCGAHFDAASRSPRDVLNFTPAHFGVAAGDNLTASVTVRVDSRLCRDIAVFSFAHRAVVPLDVDIAVSQSPGGVSPDGRVVLVAQGFSAPANSSVSIQWTCPSGNLNLSDPRVSPAGSSSVALALGPTALAPRARYILAVTVEGIDGEGRVIARGMATTNLSTTEPPSGGRLVVTPLIIEAQNTKVHLSAEAWVASSAQGELLFEFSLYDGRGLNVIISEWGTATQASFVPTSDYGAGTVAELMYTLRIRDSYSGAITQAYTAGLRVVPDPEEGLALGPPAAVGAMLDMFADYSPGVFYNSVVAAVSSTDCSSAAGSDSMLELITDDRTPPATAGQRNQGANALAHLSGCALDIARRRPAVDNQLVALLLERGVRIISPTANTTSEQLLYAEALMVEDGTATWLGDLCGVAVNLLQSPDSDNATGSEIGSVEIKDQNMTELLRGIQNLLAAVQHAAMITAAVGEGIGISSERTQLQFSCSRAVQLGAANGTNGSAHANNSAAQVAGFSWAWTPRDERAPWDPVDLCTASWPHNPYSVAYPSANRSLSALHTYSWSTALGSEIRTADNVYTFSIPFNASMLDPAEGEQEGRRQPLCVWWDDNISDWSAEGCTTVWDNESSSATCVCTHLTDFAIVSGAPSVQIPDVSKLLQRAAQIRFTIAGARIASAVFLAVFALCSCAAVAVAAYRTRHDYRDVLLREIQADEARSRGIYQGALRAPATYREATQRPLAQDIRRTMHYVDYGCGYLADRVRDGLGRVSNDHPWLRPFRANSGHFDAPRRICVLCCLTASVLCISALLFRSLGDNSIDLSLRVTFFIATLLGSGLLVRVVDPSVSFLLMRARRPMPKGIRERRRQVEVLLRQREQQRYGEWWRPTEPTEHSEDLPAAVDSDWAAARDPRIMAAALLAVFDSDGDGELDLADFNELLSELFEAPCATWGRWTPDVFASMLAELGGPSSERMTAEQLSSFYCHAGGPAFGQLRHHYRSCALGVDWTDAQSGRHIDLWAVGEDRVLCSTGANEQEVYGARLLGGGDIELVGTGIRTVLPPGGDALRRRIALVCATGLAERAQASPQLREIMDYREDEAGRQQQPEHSPSGQTSPPPGLQDRERQQLLELHEELTATQRMRLAPPRSESDRDSSSQVEDGSASLPQPGGLSFPTTPGLLGNTLVSSGTTQRRPQTRRVSFQADRDLFEPSVKKLGESSDRRLAEWSDRRVSESSDKKLSESSDTPRKGGTNVSPLGTPGTEVLPRAKFWRRRDSIDSVESKEVLLRRASRLTPPGGSPVAGEQRQPPCRQPSAAGSSHTWQFEHEGAELEERRGSGDARRDAAAQQAAERRRHRLGRRRSLGSAEVLHEVTQAVFSDRGIPTALQAWSVLDEVPEGSGLSALECREVLRGERLCARALCAVSVGAHLALRGAEVPGAVIPEEAAPAEVQTTNAVTVVRRPGEPLGVIVAGDPLTLRAIDPGGPAEAAGAARFIGRRLERVNGSTATLAELRRADKHCQVVELCFDHGAPQPGDTVAPRPGVSLGGCLRPGTQGKCVLVGPAEGGGASVLVRRELGDATAENWYDAESLRVVDRAEADAAAQFAEAVTTRDLDADQVLVPAGVAGSPRPAQAPARGGSVSIAEVVQQMQRGAHNPQQEQLWFEQNLWHRDCNKAAWRVGLELVLEGRLEHAAAVFEVVPLLLNPDLFFLLHPLAAVPPGGLTLAGAVGRAAANPSVGALWVRHYASLHLPPGPWADASWRCGSLPSHRAGPLVFALLGLQDCHAPFAAFGGASFHLKVEDAPVAQWEDVSALVGSGRLLEAAHVARKVHLSGITRSQHWERAHYAWGPSGVLPISRCSKVIAATVTRSGGRAVAGDATRHTAPYCGFYPKPGVRDMGRCDRIAARLLNPLLGEARHQPSFYHTIEYARLLVLLLAEQKGMKPWAAVLRMLQQERRAVENRDKMGLEFRGAQADEVPSNSGPRGLHRMVGSVIGAVHEPARDFCSGTPNNNCAQCDFYRPNAFLTALLCAHLAPEGAGEAAADVRFVQPNYPTEVSHADYGRDEVWALLPFRQLGRFLWPAAGSGLRINPHCGILQAAASARVGDTLLLTPGLYGAARVEGLSGTHRNPVRFAAQGHEKAVADALRWRPAAQPVARQRLPPDSTAPVLTPVRQGPPGVLLTLVGCRFVELRGLRFRAGPGMPTTVGADLSRATDVLVRDCVFSGMYKPLSLGRWSEAELTALYARNYFDGTRVQAKHQLECSQRYCRAEHASWVRFVGYAIAALVFSTLLLLCLFVTAGFSAAEAEEWAGRACFTVLFDIFVLQPLIIIMQSFLSQFCSDLDGGAEVSTDAMADMALA